MSGVLNWVLEWHKRACPEPDGRALDVQLGCHLEEIVEMLQSLEFAGGSVLRNRIVVDLDDLATGLKAGDVAVASANRRELLDSLADQVVTAIGVGYRARMQPVEAVVEVDCSNWSKFGEDGKPIFNENGKVIKGPNYREPNLEGLY